MNPRRLTVSSRVVASFGLITVTLATPRTSASQQPITLSLGSAARMAAEHSAAPEAARLRIAEAEARVRQRRADFLPSLSAVALDNERTFNSASFGISFADPVTGKSLFDPNGQILGPVKTWDVRGTLRQNLFNPSAFAHLRAAEAGVTASDADARSVAQQVAATAATSYVRALRASAQIGARMADSTLASQLLDIARAQLSAGVGVALDVTRAQSQVSLMHSQLIAARAERERAQIELVRATGLPTGTPITLADSLLSPAMPSGAPTETNEAAVIELASRTRADIRAAAEQAAAAERQLDATRAEALPALSLFADQGSTGKATQHLLSTYTWGIALSVPLFDGFRRSGREDEQRMAIRELDVRRHDLEQQVAADVQAALVDLRSATELLAASEERVSFAEQEVAQARDRFSAGVSGNADAITASLALNAARTQMIDARAALAAARVSLAKAQGTVTDLP